MPSALFYLHLFSLVICASISFSIYFPCLLFQSAVYESIKEHQYQVDLLFGSTVTALRVDKIDENTVGPAVVTLSPSSTSSSSSSGVRTLTARWLFLPFYDYSHMSPHLVISDVIFCLYSCCPMTHWLLFLSVHQLCLPFTPHPDLFLLLLHANLLVFSPIRFILDRPSKFFWLFYRLISLSPFLFSSSHRLVVGADGANSQIRHLGGFGSWGWGYGQEAVVCTVKVAPRDQALQTNGELVTGFILCMYCMYVRMYSMKRW